MSDDKVMITLSYKGKSVTFDDDTLRRANSALSGGFAGKEDKIGKPAVGNYLCPHCGDFIDASWHDHYEITGDSCDCGCSYNCTRPGGCKETDE